MRRVLALTWGVAACSPPPQRNRKGRPEGRPLVSSPAAIAVILTRPLLRVLQSRQFTEGLSATVARLKCQNEAATAAEYPFGDTVFSERAFRYPLISVAFPCSHVSYSFVKDQKPAGAYLPGRCHYSTPVSFLQAPIFGLFSMMLLGCSPPPQPVALPTDLPPTCTSEARLPRQPPIPRTLPATTAYAAAVTKAATRAVRERDDCAMAYARLRMWAQGVGK